MINHIYIQVEDVLVDWRTAFIQACAKRDALEGAVPLLESWTTDLPKNRNLYSDHDLFKCDCFLHTEEQPLSLNIAAFNQGVLNGEFHLPDLMRDDIYDILCKTFLSVTLLTRFRELEEYFTERFKHPENNLIKCIHYEAVSNIIQIPDDTRFLTDSPKVMRCKNVHGIATPYNLHEVGIDWSFTAMEAVVKLCHENLQEMQANV